MRLDLRERRKKERVLEDFLYVQPGESSLGKSRGAKAWKMRPGPKAIGEGQARPAIKSRWKEGLSKDGKSHQVGKEREGAKILGSPAKRRWVENRG